VRKLSGLTSSEGDLDRQLSDFVELNRRKLTRVPYIYQRIFRTEPLEEERFFVGREEPVRRIEESFKRSKDGFPVSAAIIAEKGNGKTTILNRTEKSVFRGTDVVRVEFQRTFFAEIDICRQFALAFDQEPVSSFDSLERYLSELESKRVIVLENIQNTFLRTMNGFDALEKMLQMINRLGDRHYLLFTAGIYGWEYLDRTIGISGYFSDLINLPSFSDEEVRKLIEIRHEVSGYGLNYLVLPGAEKDRSYRKLNSEEQRQNWLATMFFRKLAEHARGNIKTALMFWLNAIDSFTDEQIIIDPTINLDPSFLYQLPKEEIFTLAAFAHHEFLTPSEHALVFKQSADKSLILLRNMHKRGILDVVEENYVIQPFVYRAVIRGLKMKNILD